MLKHSTAIAIISASLLIFFVLILAINGFGIVYDGNKPVTIGKIKNLIQPNKPTTEILLEKRIIHTAGQKFDEETQKYHGKPIFVPDTDTAIQTHILKQCNVGYEPLAVWHETTDSFPSINIMYTINPHINSQTSETSILLRARKNKEGYAYIKIFTLCSII